MYNLLDNVFSSSCSWRYGCSKGWLTQYNGSAEITKKDSSNKPVIVSINGQSIA